MAHQWLQHSHAAGRSAGNEGINFPRIYDALIFLMTRGRDRVYRAAVLDLAGVAAGSDVLDMGCGTGTQAVESWRRVQTGGSVTAVDISESMLSAARRKAARAGCDIAFHAADAASLPFPDASFDVVTMTTVLHMIPEDRRQPSLGEAARVLRRGGRLLLIDYAGAIEGRRHLMAKHGRHGQFDLDAVQPMLAAAGLEPAGSGSLGWLSLHFLRAIKR